MKNFLIFGSVILGCLLVFLFLKDEETHTSTEVVATPQEASPSLKTSPPSAPKPPSPPKKTFSIPAVENKGFKNIVDRNQPLNHRISNNLSHFPETAPPADQLVLAGVLKDTDEANAVRNEAARILLRSGYPITKDIKEIRARSDESDLFKAYCIQYLALRSEEAPDDEKEDIKKILHSSLEDKSDLTKAEALLALTNMKDPIAEVTTLAWLSGGHGDSSIRIAVRCAQKLDLKDSIPTIRALINSHEPTVQIASIVALSQWKDSESIPLIREATKSENPRVQKCATMALKRMAN